MVEAEKCSDEFFQVPIKKETTSSYNQAPNDKHRLFYFSFAIVILVRFLNFNLEG